MKIIFSVIAFLGLLCAVAMHVAATICFDWTRNPDTATLFEILLGVGLALLLLTIIFAWDWTMNGFLANLIEEMPWLARVLVAVTFCYAFFINQGAKYSGGMFYAIRKMHPEYYPSLIHAWQWSSFLIPLFLLPMVYFWKEREYG